MNTESRYVILGPGLAERRDFSNCRRYGYKLNEQKDCSDLSSFLENLEYQILEEKNDIDEKEIYNLIEKKIRDDLLALFPINQESHLFQKLFSKCINFVFVSPNGCESSAFSLGLDEDKNGNPFISCPDLDGREPCNKHKDRYEKCDLHEKNFPPADKYLKEFFRSNRTWLSNQFVDQLGEVPVFTLSSAIDILRWHSFCNVYKVLKLIEEQTIEGAKERIHKGITEKIRSRLSNVSN